MIFIDRSMSDDEILYKIETALQDKKKLQDISNKMYKYNISGEREVSNLEIAKKRLLKLLVRN